VVVALFAADKARMGNRFTTVSALVRTLQFSSGSLKLRKANMTKKKTFRSMNGRIEELVNSPLIAADVRRYAAEREHVNRVYAQGLADIRRAGKLTQQQLADSLNTDQGTVSRIERRHDLLLSTLRDYLVAAGVEHSRIVVEREGVEIVLDLDSFARGDERH